MLKVLFVPTIFKFFSWLFDHLGKRLNIRKVELISKFITSQTSKQMITKHILLKISITKGNQEMKFGQLIEYNMRSFFQKNFSENVAERLAPDLFLIFKKLYVRSK